MLQIATSNILIGLHLYAAGKRPIQNFTHGIIAAYSGAGEGVRPGSDVRAVQDVLYSVRV